MIIKNAKIFDGEKFIGENAVFLEGKFIKKIVNFSLIDKKELENQCWNIKKVKENRVGTTRRAW